MEKGILGVKKDPKNPMFFSFAGGEGWPSSDSSDSDYSPESPVLPKKRRVEGKIQKALPREQKNVRKSKGKASAASSTCTDSAAFVTKAKNGLLNKKKVNDILASSSQLNEPKLLKIKTDKRQSVGNLQASDVDCWGRLLPEFVLVKIFQYVVDFDGPLPFLCRAAKVSRLWNDVAKQSVLWRRLDLSIDCVAHDECTLQTILKVKNLRQLKEVNLSQWKKLTNSGLQALADSCRQLSWIKLSGTRVTAASLVYLVDQCPDLTGFDLSSMETYASYGNSLNRIIEKRGSRMTSLNLSFNKFKNFNQSMKLIANTCSQLRVLEICNVEFTTNLVVFDIEKMQTCCTHLRVLRLSNAPFRSNHASATEQATSPGFPELEELSIGLSSSGRGLCLDVSNNVLHRILKQSRGLKVLDLRGCTSVTCESLQSLPVTDLEHLYISSSSAAKYEGIEIIMTKWQHSLIVLDLSWNIYPGMSLDMAMKKLASDPAKSKLQILDLKGTQISCARVKSILEGCPRLNSLLLESCRGLPRGMKKEYSGDSLTQLRKDIDSLVTQAEQDSAGTTRDLCLPPST